VLQGLHLLANPPYLRGFLFSALPCVAPYYEEPTSGLEPLTCSLRVIYQALQGHAEVCKSRIPKLFSFLCLALCCTVLRARWCQSGVKLLSGAIHPLPPILHVIGPIFRKIVVILTHPDSRHMVLLVEGTA
jgi:hypothetical protein